MKFSNKVAIVTGGAGSMGQVICATLAHQGAKVVVNDFGQIETSQRIVTDIKNAGGIALAIESDVANAEAVAQLVNTTLLEFGGVDFLITCAGIATGNYVVDMSEDEWDRVLDINLKGVFLCCCAVLPTLIEQRSGRIVNIASLVARQGSYKHAHYAASKAGVIAFTQSLAKEVGQYGICVNAISPGRITSTMEADRQSQERTEWIAQTPLGRMGEPPDIANAVAFLCSEEASFITGEVLNVNGGLWMG
jgi:3-oxoacyl-[acyl-carrier protein] reductase